MKIFIDANKYLDLLRLYQNENSKDIIQFLKTKQKEGVFSVVVTDQVIDEFRRNKYMLRGHKVVSYNLQISAPSYLKGNEELKEVKKIKDNLDKSVKKVQKEYLLELEKQAEVVENLIKDIKPILASEDIINRANMRILKGNPPGKTRNCIGDAISWETLMEFCSGDDLIIISRDSDFCDKLTKVEDNAISPFLEEEWRSKNKKTVKICHSFSSLMDLFSTKDEKKEINSIREDEGLTLTINPSLYMGMSTIGNPSILSGANVTTFTVPESIVFPVFKNTAGVANTNSFSVVGSVCRNCQEVYINNLSINTSGLCDSCFMSGVGTSSFY